MSIGPSLICLMCSRECSCQHAVCMQSWSQVTLADRRKTLETAESSGRLCVCEGGGHRRHHLYFIDFSISVSVHGSEVGEQSLSAWPACQFMFGLYHCTPHLFPSRSYSVDPKRSDFLNHNEQDAIGVSPFSRFIWCYIRKGVDSKCVNMKDG